MRKIYLYSSMLCLLITMLFFSETFKFSLFINRLDSTSKMVSYDIGKNIIYNDEFILSLEKKYDLSITLNSDAVYSYGDVVEYKTTKLYHPFLASYLSIPISTTQYAILGIYE